MTWWLFCFSKMLVLWCPVWKTFLKVAWKQNLLQAKWQAQKCKKQKRLWQTLTMQRHKKEQIWPSFWKKRWKGNTKCCMTLKLTQMSLKFWNFKMIYDTLKIFLNHHTDEFLDFFIFYLNFSAFSWLNLLAGPFKFFEPLRNKISIALPISLFSI